MSERDLIRLKHIKDAIKNIKTFTKNISRAEFIKNELINSAVVRQFEIIGEATNSLTDKIKRKQTGIEWHKANAMRNILIHEYFKVDLGIIWETIYTDLPDLERKIKKLIKQYEK